MDKGFANQETGHLQPNEDDSEEEEGDEEEGDEEEGIDEEGSDEQSDHNFWYESYSHKSHTEFHD